MQLRGHRYVLQRCVMGHVEYLQALLSMWARPSRLNIACQVIVAVAVYVANVRGWQSAEDYASGARAVAVAVGVTYMLPYQAAILA
jgi:hypothetical protein